MNAARLRRFVRVAALTTAAMTLALAALTACGDETPPEPPAAALPAPTAAAPGLSAEEIAARILRQRPNTPEPAPGETDQEQDDASDQQSALLPLARPTLPPTNTPEPPPTLPPTATLPPPPTMTPTPAYYGPAGEPPPPTPTATPAAAPGALERPPILIVGRITDSYGRPLSGVMAEARNDDYQPPVMGRTRSDSAGVYRLMIPYRPGDMTLSWSLTGYHTRQETYRSNPAEPHPGPTLRNIIMKTASAAPVQQPTPQALDAVPEH